MRFEELSGAEREIMEIVWARGEVSAAEARDLLPREVARNTVRTLLERMEDKGWVSHRNVGRTFVYRAARPRDAVVGFKVREVIDTLCGGSPELLVAAMLDYRGLKPQELERIRQMLEQAKGRRRKKTEES